eukprot:2695760-Amphidinium_carterae.1
MAFYEHGAEIGEQSAVVTLGGFTDSQVSAQVLTKGMTTSFPMALVLMELSAQLEKRKAKLHLYLVPRDKNEEADALSNQDWRGFDPSRRKLGHWSDMKFEVLPDLWQEAREFFELTRSKKAALNSEGLSKP